MTVSSASRRASGSGVPAVRALARTSNARRTWGKPARASPRASAAPYLAETDDPREGRLGARRSGCAAIFLAVAASSRPRAPGSMAAAATRRPRTQVAPWCPPPASRMECSVQRPIAPSSARSSEVAAPLRRAQAAIAARPGTSAFADQRRARWSCRVIRAPRSRGSGRPGLGVISNCRVSAATAACASVSSSRLLMGAAYEADSELVALSVGASVGGSPDGGVPPSPPPPPAPVFSASGSTPRVRKPL